MFNSHFKIRLLNKWNVLLVVIVALAGMLIVCDKIVDPPIQPLPPSTPMLLLPNNDATGVDSNTAFKWTQVRGASSYHLQISPSESFYPCFIDTSNFTYTACTIRKFKKNTTYRWRVHASNEAGESSWSDTRMFKTIDTTPPPCTETVFNNEKYGISFNYCSNLLTYLEKDSLMEDSYSHKLVDIGMMIYIKSGIIGSVDICAAWPITSVISPSALISNLKSSLLNNFDCNYISSDSSDINGHVAGKIYYSYTSSTNVFKKGVYIGIIKQPALYQFFFECQYSGFETFETYVLDRFYSTVNIYNGSGMGKIAVTAVENNLEKIVKAGISNYSLSTANKDIISNLSGK